MPSQDSHDYDRIDQLAERWRRGERPTVEEYVERYPNLADGLREFLPAMVQIEEAKEEARLDEAPTATAAPDLRQLGDFHILREVGQGGMGVVYEAEQLSLGRRVALKVLRGKPKDGRQKRRFEREARAAARLHHTNIVPVFGVGEHEGQPYYVMQFIQGLGLDDVIRELHKLGAAAGKPITPQTGEVRISRSENAPAAELARSLLTGEFQKPSTELPLSAPTIDQPLAEGGGPHAEASHTLRLSDTFASSSSSSAVLPGIRHGAKRQSYWHSVAHLGVQVASALDYAHRQGILHRDVKPSNLLLDTAGTVWVTDFGLAKIDDHQNLTHTGDILGTLRYMPPEAFESKTDQRADIYSLGLTLYEMLALRPAFQEKDRPRLVKLVTTGEPERLERLNRAVPRDLATIVHKAIDRDPAARYQTAAEMEADLERFQRDEPIRARPVTWRERARKWVRRNPAVAMLVGAVAVLLVAVASVASVAYWRTSNALVKVESAAEREKEARGQADADRARLRLTMTDMNTSFGLTASERDRPATAALWFAHAAMLAEKDSPRETFNRMRVASWTERVPRPVRALRHDAIIVRQMRFHPLGRHLITYGETDAIVWDLASEEKIVFNPDAGPLVCAAWKPDGTQIALGYAKGDVQVHDFPSLKHARSFPAPTDLRAVEYSSDGVLLALAGETLFVRGAKAGDIVLEAALKARPERVVFHPANKSVVVGCLSNTAVQYSLSGAESVRALARLHYAGGFIHGGRVATPPIFLNGGRTLLTRSASKEVSLWDNETGLLRAPPVSTGAVYDVAVSLDDRHLLLAAEGSIAISEVGSAAKPRLLSGHTNTVTSIAMHPGGEFFASASTDRMVRFYSVPEGRPMLAPLEHPNSVHHAQFSPDGRFLATAQQGGLIRIWSMPEPASRKLASTPTPSSPTQTRLSPDGKYVAASGSSFRSCQQTSTQVFDLASGKPAGPELDLGRFRYLCDAAFSPDGQTLFTLTNEALQAWDWKKGVERFPSFWLGKVIEGKGIYPRAMALRKDGGEVAVYGITEIIVVDTQAGIVRRRWQTGHKWVEPSDHLSNGSIAFSPDEKSLITWGADSNAYVWDAATGAPRFVARHHKLKCHDVAFSPDGNVMVTSGFDREVRFWRWPEGGEAAPPLTHPDWVFSSRFSRDGKRLLTCSRDGSARLWDLATRTLVCPPLRHEADILGASFLDNERLVITASRDRSMQVWETVTGRPVFAPFRFPGIVFQAQPTPDERHVAIGGFTGGSFVALLPEWSDARRSPEADLLRSELLAGQAIEDGAGVATLTEEQWLMRWRELRKVAAAGFERDGLALKTRAIEPRETVTTPAETIVVGGFARAKAALTEKEIAEAIDAFLGPDGKQSAKAFNRLLAAGPEVLPALRAAPAAATAVRQVETQRLIDQLELQSQLTLAPVRLKMKDEPLDKAVAALAETSGARLASASKALKVSLDLDGVPFWEALEQVSKATKLRPTTLLSGGLQLAEGPIIPAAGAGPIWIELERVSVFQGLDPRTGPTNSPANFVTRISSVKPLAGLKIASDLRVLEFRDDKGTLTKQDPPRFAVRTPLNVPVVRSFSIKVPVGAKSVPWVKLGLGVEATVRRSELLTIKEIKAGARSAGGPAQMSLARADRNAADTLIIQVDLFTAGQFVYHPDRFAFRLEDDKGNVLPPSLTAVYPAPSPLIPAEAAALAVGAFEVPWPALFRADFGGKIGAEAHGSLTFPGFKGELKDYRLVLEAVETAHTELYFELRDLPLP